MEIYKALFRRWGPQYWWPAEDPLEMMIGAILTQNTSWKNVEKAITNLKCHNALDIHVLDRVRVDELASWLKPAGYFNMKAARVKSFICYLKESWGADVTAFLAQETSVLRSSLLGVKGIGPETADSIILYAAHRPVFVVDAYTRRVMERHGWALPDLSYDALAALFNQTLPAHTELYNEYHALIVKLGKEHCKSRPQCDRCPLEPYLPIPRN